MGGFFGVVSENDAVLDAFFGTDYHSHLGTRRAGMAAVNSEIGIQRKIHKIENSPFRTKFENILNDMSGNASIGCISDSDPQPLVICSNLGNYAICMVGVLNNSEALVKQYLSFSGGHFSGMTGAKINSCEIVAAMINQKSSFVEGIKFAQDVIEGSASILILTESGKLIAARDKLGRTPVLLGKRDDGFCVSFEDFAYKKLGYDDYKELGPGEIVEITSKEVKVLVFAKGDKLAEAEAAGADFFGGEELIPKIQNDNWFDYDVVVATPDMMGVVGRLGKVLGPKGLMPSPKAGTVTMDVTKAVKEIKSGKIEYRLDKTNIIHCPIGKVSFGTEKLGDNFRALLSAIIKAKPAAAKGQYIKSCAVASTMGPGVKINQAKLSD